MFEALAMFEALEGVVARPRPFAFYTTKDLWNDPHVSVQMLALHLDETAELASRPRAAIEASAGWLISHFAIGPGTRVCDLGCGPGLYASRFARAGAQVAGVDFSERSIAHAREAAAREGLAIDYALGDYLEGGPAGPFDLVTLIFYDFCVLGPEQRAALLARVRGMLAPGGAMVLDAVSPAFFDAAQEKSAFTHHPAGGFWSAEAHFVFQVSFKYAAERLLLEKFVVVEPARTRESYNWIQCHDVDGLRAEFARAGLAVTETWGDLAGKAFDAAATEFAVVARKAG